MNEENKRLHDFPIQLELASFRQTWSNMLARGEIKMSDAEKDFRYGMIERLISRDVLNYASQYVITNLLQLDCVDLHSLAFDSNDPTVVYAAKVSHVESPVERGCHISAALHWFLNQDLEIWSGIDKSDNWHSWLFDVKGNTVYEPTPIPRERYYGFKRENPSQFFTDHLLNISECRDLFTNWDRFKVDFEKQNPGQFL